MRRRCDFHAPIHSAAFAIDRHVRGTVMDDGVKKDLWLVIKNFSKALEGKH